MPQILRFALTNHRSILDRQELSFVAARITDEPTHLLPVPGRSERLLPALGIYGANASGKSNLLGGLDWGLRFIRDGQRMLEPRQPIPREPFLLDAKGPGRPTTWELEFQHDGTRYEYGFSVTDRVEEEWLASYPQGRRRLLFERNGDEPVHFGRHLRGDRRRAEAFVRPNSLLLSAGAQNNHELLGDLQIALTAGIRIGVQSEQELRAALVKDAGRARAALLLRTADVGIEGVFLRPASEAQRERIVRLMLNWTDQIPDEAEQRRAFEKILPVENLDSFRMLGSMAKENIATALGAAPDAMFGTVEFRHRTASGAGAFLPREAESAGTLSFLRAAMTATSSLAAGHVLAIDELDTSLHPLLARSIVGLFQSPKTNPKGAQLLFTTHDTNLLDRRTLRRDQVWFTEKDGSGATCVYPLTDIKTRKTDNIQRGYLQGRFGAIPFIGDQDFRPGDEVA